MKKRVTIILPLILGTFMAALDTSIVNVSLPVMRQQFNCRIDEVEWVITAYMLAFCVFMPLTNWLKNKIGLFNLYVTAISVFAAGSILCGFSNSLATIIPSRILQALGGGAVTPAALAILSSVFSKEERGTVMGWWGLGVVIGPALGPTLGGVITRYLGWPYIFFVNIPFAALALILSFRYLRKIKYAPKQHIPFDTSGFIFFTLFIVLLQYSVASIAILGTGNIWLWVSFAAAVISFVVYYRVDKNKKHAIIDFNVFKNPVFVNITVVTLCRSAALFGGVFLLPFLLQGLMGYTELDAGLLLLPNSAMIAILTPIAGKWSDKHGAKQVSLLGLVLVTASMYYFSTLTANSSLFNIITAMIIRGAGLGLLISPLSSAMLNAVSSDKTAIASSLYSLFMQIGGSIGISILGVIHQLLIAHYEQAGRSATLAEQYALKGGFLVSMVIAGIAIWPVLKFPKQIPATQKEPVKASKEEALS